MPAPDWENLAEFFDCDEFATRVVIETQSGETRQFSALFDYPYIDPDAGIYDYDTTAPRLTCPESDAAGIGRGDYATVDGTPYDIVAKPEPDGTGLATIKLSSPT